MAEFDLIKRIRLRVSPRADVLLGIGDDAAIVQVPADRQLAICADTLNAGVHFPLATAPEDIGWKALGVNLSDLAAMGAQPAWCTLSLSMPSDDPAWLDAFLDGFLELASQHQVTLIGGDTTRGPLSISVTAHGLVEPGRALPRDGAQAGDDVWVSGSLGDAAAALALLDDAAEREVSPTPPARASTLRDGGATSAVARSLRIRLDRPQPRVALGCGLVGIANAMIDISDGLWADLGHVCLASGIGAEIQLAALPCSPALAQAFDAAARRILQTAGGDDYELCFTAPREARTQIEVVALRAGVQVTRVGRMVAEVDGVYGLEADGSRWQPPRAGWVHFSE